MKRIIFQAYDTLFFKEARPMDGFGGSQLKGTFPPPVRTMAGALRTLIGDQHGVNWSKFTSDSSSYADLRTLIGDATSYGRLTFGLTTLKYKGTRLYPAPRHLVFRDSTISKMEIGDAIETDMGRVRFPILPTTNTKERFAPLPEGSWIDEAGLREVLNGGVPEKFYQSDELFLAESRIGIARDNTTRTVREGMLYQTAHIRPQTSLEVELEVDGLSDLPPSGLCRLGAEGRFASWRIEPGSTRPQASKPHGLLLGVTLIALTPVLAEPHWSIGVATKDGTQSFINEYNDVQFRIVSACVGRSVREGGFDIASGKSRAASSYLPAGSIWFCEIDSNIPIEEAVKRLDGMRIGGETELGRGILACGFWTK
ncbi:MAG: hypothetical protein K6347_02435 [Campylobacterales bacterium]